VARSVASPAARRFLDGGPGGGRPRPPGEAPVTQQLLEVAEPIALGPNVPRHALGQQAIRDRRRRRLVPGEDPGQSFTPPLVMTAVLPGGTGSLLGNACSRPLAVCGTRGKR
jgi:hypothetical protein